MEIVFQAALLVLGFMMLMKGADWFVEGASGIAEKFHIPPLVIGLTIVACGTSAPEAAVSITAALKGNADITIGNIVGSNILNILLILGITSIIIPVAVQKISIKFDMPVMIAVSVLLYFIGGMDRSLNRIDGLILLVLFGIFLFFLFRITKNTESDQKEEPKKEKPVYRIWIWLATVLGLLLIVAGSDVTVNSATKIAEFFGISDRIIGLTIVAFGTSLPELITSVTAAIKGKADIAIGNVVGSNIFNILFIVGLSAVITPVPFVETFFIDSMICIASAVLLLVCVIKDLTLKRSEGIFMLVCYATYFVYLIS